MKHVILAAAALTVTMTGAAEARNELRIVSSPGDFPYTSMVGESFSRGYHQPMPIIQRSGARTNIRLFCNGVGVAHPDIVSLPRPMRDAEIEECKRNGVQRITQIKVGYEAIVLARRRGAVRFDVSRMHLFKALARVVPVNGRLTLNPYKRWSDIDPSLPSIPIRVSGPRADSDLRQAFLKLVMDETCRSFPEIAKLNKPLQTQLCTTFRTDGAFRTIARNYNDSIRFLERDPSRIVLMPYSVYEKTDHLLSTVRVEGAEPNLRTVAERIYPITCPLFVYVKTQHSDRVPGILEFVTEFTSDRAWGPEGYLAEGGLIPMSERERRSQRANAIGLSPMRQ